MLSKKILVLGVCVLLVVHTVQGNPFVIVGVAANVLGAIIRAIDHGQPCSVTVENKGRHHAHLWCASKDDKIGGNDGIWVPPGQSLGWTFRKKGSTQFWCTMDWYGRRYGWDVYVANWGGNTGRWVIKDDGIYEGGGAKRMPIESNVPV